MVKPAKVFIAVPTYKKECHSDLIFKQHVIVAPGSTTTYGMGNFDSSAICMTMNFLWLQALDAYAAGHITHFMMWHTDVIPEDYFLDKMMAIMEREGADIVSAVIPIKNDTGMSSTAVEGRIGDTDPRYRVRRYSMKEIAAFPPTFTGPEILLNDGLMLVDLSKEWTRNDDVFFNIEDKIIRYHGKRLPVMIPEDWVFSRRARAAGAKKLCATREVHVIHVGLADFPNDAIWGQATDSVPGPALEFAAAAEAADKVQGFMTWDELAWLAEAAKGKEVVEVGSWLGRSTKALAATALKVYCIDHWKGTENDLTKEIAKTINPWDTFVKNLADEIDAFKVIPMMVDHGSKEFEQLEVLAEQSGHTWAPDMVFIDGGHTREDVERDIRNALKMLAPGGLICGHDFSPSHPGVQEAVRALLPEARVFNNTSIWFWTVASVTKPELKLVK